MWVIAHRGASGYAPENTMAAFRRAVELGATFIETDLQLTRDAYLVAMHDDTLDRTTSGSGAVSRFTRAELSELDAGAWRGAEFAGERIPTLEEVLAFALEHDVIFYLELKSMGTWGAVETLVGAIERARAASNVVVISFDAPTIEAVMRRDRMLMTGILFDRADAEIARKTVRIGARQLAPRGNLVTPELLAEARAVDLQVVTWTINKPEDMRRLAAVAVNGIITDYPDRLAAVLRDSLRGS
jgi:glycerophosphoryl diester phosphodiesterase